MVIVKSWMRLLVLLAIIPCLGCASAYHSYSDCCVDCNYAVPPPLPEAQYASHVCHSHAVSGYIAGQSQPPDDQNEAAENDPRDELRGPSYTKCPRQP